MKEMFFCLMLVIVMMSSCTSAGDSNRGNSENIKNSASANMELKESGNKETPDKAVSAPSQTKKNEPFDYLEKISVDEEILVKYNPTSTTVYNTKVTDLPQSDPFYPKDEGPDMGNVKLVKTQIKPGGSYYYVVFSWGPSADPAFMFYEEGNTDELTFSLSGERLFIPGNGNVYVDGHTNNYFNTRRKLKLVDGQLIEIEQPYYYVGLKSHTLKPAKLYQSDNLNKVIANLPIDYSVEVLINKPGTDLFLVKTDFGMTGWLKLGNNAFYGNEVIKGLFYAGD